MYHWRSMILLLLHVLLCGLVGTNASSDQPADVAPEDRSINFTFTQPLYNVSVYQNAMPRTRLIPSSPHMGVTLVGGRFPPEKPGGPPFVEFRMVKETKPFVVRANRVGDFYFLDIRTSDHVLNSNLNREKQSSHAFAVTATYRAGSVSMTCRTTVFVEVLDYNDNCPIFRYDKYNFTVSDDMPVGTPLGRVEATDADVGINARIYFVMWDRTQHFRLDPYSGTLYLARPINAHTFPRQHRINIQAVERGSSEHRALCLTVSRMDVIITVKVTNRYSPTATVQTLSAIHTPGRRGTVYAVIKVNDEDIGLGGKIDRVEIVNETALGDFAVRRVSDKQFSLVLRRDITQMHLYRVEDVYLRVWDAGKPPRSILIPQKVNFVNNNQYQLSLPKRIDLQVSENALVNTTIYCLNATVAIKMYNARIFYNYIPTIADPSFVVHPSGAVVVRRPLDKETRPGPFVLDVEASDSNNYFGEMVVTTRVQIQILDANDNPPVVRNDKMTVKIPESAAIGSLVLKIDAYDPDGATTLGGPPLIYKLINEEALPFGLDPRDQSRIVVDSKLDSELMPERFTLSVRVSDRGPPLPRRTDAEFTVILLPTNDNAPIFKWTRCKVHLGNRATDVSTFEAIDLDGHHVNYKFAKEYSCFSISRSTGHVGITCPLNRLPATTVLLLQADDSELKSKILEVTVVYKHNSNSSSSSNCVSSGIEDLRDSLYGRRVDYSSRLSRLEENERRKLGPSREENRYSPVFDAKMKRTIHVYEDKKVGSTLMQITAEDKDDGHFSYAGRVVYAIARGNSNDTFQLQTHEEQTATLSLLRPLDRERQSKYNLVLRACDLGVPQRCSEKKLRVVVSDVNDCAPVFARGRRRRIYIPENKKVGSRLYLFNATDCDSGRFGRVRFRLRSHRRTFNISRRGQLYLKSRLDRESQSRYVLLIRAYNKMENETAKVSKSSYLEFEVVVTDVNDNRPKFVPSHYQLTLMEDLPRGAYVTSLHAVDPDEGLHGLIRYRLIGKDATCFSCDAISGVVRLDCPLSYKRRYQLIAVASDQGTPPLKTQTEVDIRVRAVQLNLRPPVFPPDELHFEATVLENSPPDTYVTRLSANDPEKMAVSYRIIGGSGMGRFRIGDRGVIRTNEVLDYETASSYWLLVQARDNGIVPLTAFSEIYVRVVDVNDNAPMPMQPEYSATVVENAPSGVELVRVQAYDMDGASQGRETRLEYVITKGDPGFFDMGLYTGQLTTKNRIDRESHREFTLEVTIYDRGSPPLNSTVNVYIHVEDENDKAPEFVVRALTLVTFPVDISVKNSSRKQLAIGRVVAYDKDALNNGTVTYSLDNYEETFRVDSETGHIYPRVSLTPKTSYILRIRATDGGKPPLYSVTSVSLDVVPFPPKPKIPGAQGRLQLNVEDYFVSENISPGSSLSLVSAKDPDEVSRRLVFYIREERIPVFLEPMPYNPGDTHHSTVLRIAQPLDFEEQKRYNLTLCVTNGLQTVCRPFLIKVTDLNEWRPVFDRAEETAQISETLPVGSTVVKLSAQDRDPGRGLQYRIEFVEQAETRRLFKLNPISGILTVASPLDHERITFHTMLVTVFDMAIGRTFHASCIVKVRVTDSNEAAPHFLVTEDMLPLTATVRDNSPIGSKIIQLSAFDSDRGEGSAQLHYEITNGNWDRLFRIDEAGYILVNESLMGVTSKSYQLEVTVTDNGRPPKSNSTRVVINVKSLSDEDRPVFIKKSVGRTLHENCAVGTVVAEMFTKSIAPVFYQIIKGNELDLFSIADTTGLVVTKAPVDRERHGDYFSLTVKATSADSPDGPFDTATLSISIQDVNDNRPTVEETSLAGWISEASQAGAIVHSDTGRGPLVIKAHDPDFGLNGKLNFEIRSSIARTYFTVDGDTYAIRLRGKPLDREHQSSFLLTILVSDRGRPLRLSADQLVVVRIRVIDVNDNPPRFPVATPVDLVVQLPAFAGQMLLKTGVEDPDSVSEGHVKVRVRSGNEKNYFRVNHTNGDLYVTTDSLPPDHTFHLTLEATDGLFITRHNISVETRATRKSFSPNFHFNKKEYFAAVQENSTAVRDLIVVGINGSRRFDIFIYEIMNPSRFFTMGRTTGVLRTTGVAVDREVEGPVLKLLLRATDRRRRMAFAWILVTVEDINDCQPVFVNQPYNVIVLNTAPPGTLITKVIRAIDRDDSENGRLTFSLHAIEPAAFPRPTRFFNLNPDNGHLFLAGRLPSSVANKNFILHINVRDNGNPYLGTSALVNLQVVTKNTPVFEKSSYETSIYENAPPNEAVMTLNATSPLGATLIYSIMSGNEDEKFSLDFSSAYDQPGPCVLKTVDHLDYETKKQYKLNIRVTEKRAGLYSQVIATINIKDVNDVRPVFKDKEEIAIVSEQTIIGTTVLQVQATDEDTGSGGKVTYSLEEVEPGRHDSESFTIDEKGRVKVYKKLDYEAWAVHELWVVASDDGTPRLSSRIPVRIQLLDYNDNNPRFTSPHYHVSIADDSLAGSFVVKVTATDADVNDTISYNLQPVGRNGNDYRCFRIDKSNGQILYQPTAARSRTCNPTRSNYSLDVVGSDGVNKAVARVVVLMTPTNRHIPRFTQSNYNAFVSENQPPGTHVITVKAMDPDRGRFGRLIYFIMSEEHRWYFRIGRDSGEITTARPIDREKENMFNVLVTVQDGGKELAHANVLIHINDENDNAPAFHQSAYRINLLARDVNPHKSLFQIRADDLDHGDNSTVRYHLDEPTDFIKSAVSIGDRTGEVRLGLGIRNATALRRLQFAVRASDQGKHSLSSVVQVEILFLKIKPDFWPLIVNCRGYRDHLIEWDKVDRPIGQCYTPTTIDLTYSLLNGGLPRYNQDGRWFKIDEKGYIRTDRLLDREEIDKFQLTVQVRTDTTPPTYGTTQIEFLVADRNDVTPHFQSTRYHLWVPENIKLRTRLMQIVATDEDLGAAGRLKYALTPPIVSRDIQEEKERADKTRGVNTDVRSYFEIDGDGWLKNVRALDRETMDKFVFTVEVSNEGGTHKNFTRVQINVEDVNDNPMMWKNKKAYAKIHVNESVPMSTVVYQLEYVDKDLYALEPVRLWLLGDTSPMPFTVEAETGKVIVSGHLDREKKAKYSLEVMATDGKFSTAKPFRIDVRIDDADDNWPVCQEPFRTLKVEEGRLYNVLTRFKAVDRDEGYNARLNYKLIEGNREHFELGAESGVLAVMRVLSREAKPTHFVRVNVSDPSGHHCLFEARIIVLDINNNAPVFVRPPAIGQVPEDANPGSPIGKVHAEDLDAGLNRRIVYSLAKQDSHFSVDAQTGILYVARPLDRERQAVHELVIVATDRGTPPRNSTMSAKIRLLDVNDSPPVFRRNLYEIRVKEDQPVNEQLTRVQAISDDIGQNSVVRYRLRDNYTLFGIDANSGVLRLRQPLDFERTSKHYLNVLAVDGGTPALTGTAMVIISVLDVNDNPPRFPVGGFNTTMIENTPPGRMITRVTADDADSDANGRLAYRLVGGDPLGHFSIEENSGELVVNKPVDREKQDSFRLLVEARDFGIEKRLSATTQVHVEVQDLNDCHPQFDKRHYTFTIYVDKDGNITNAGGTSDRLSKTVAGKIYVTDDDGPGNAGPFIFSIDYGDIRHFKLETHPNHCVVTASGPLSPGEQSLTISVADSGRTPRRNSTRVRIQVVVQSRQPPVIERLNVTLSFYGSRDAPVGTIAHVRVKNRSPKDRLTYSLTTDYAGLFRIDPVTGRLFAVRSLDGGNYSVRVKVSNGSLSANSTVTVNVMALTEEMLDNAVVLRLSGFTPKLFFMQKKDQAWKRLLGTLFRISESKVYILAVQPAPDGLAAVARRYKRQVMPRLDVLTAVYSDDKLTFFSKKEVLTMLQEQADVMKSELRHDNPLVFSDVCPRSGACVEGQGSCHSRPVVFGHSTSINVMGITHTSPRFRMETYCQCRENFGGQRCEVQMNECARKPCKSPRVCQPMDGGRYRCVCPTGKTGENCELLDTQTPPDTCRDPKCQRVRDLSPMMFKGRSYMNWTLRRPNPRRFDLSLSVRTKQKDAPFIKLRWAEHRAIRFYFHKGHLVVAPMSIDVVAVRTTSVASLASSNQRRAAELQRDDSFYTPTSWLESPDRVNDGKWHRIRFRLALADTGKTSRSWLVRLTIDGIKPKIARINWHEGSAREQELLMGAEVRSLLHGYTDIRSSFAGCIKDVQIGGARLPQQTTYEQSPPFLLSRKVEVELGCSDKFLDSACAESPCLNGGECHPDYQYGTTSYTCSCSAGFQGKHCEINTDPCSTNPCHNGGTCHSRADTYICICPKGISGPKCDYGRYCGPSVNPCRNDATCIESFTGAVCQCSSKYTGKYCDKDVNECRLLNKPCNGRGGCRNTIGSFVCNCSLGYEGPRCERQNLVRLTPDNNSWMLASSKVAWIVGGIFAVVIIALLLCLVIYLCVKYRRERRRSRRFQPSPMNDLQKGETHPMIQLVTDSRLAHVNAHCYDPLLGSGTRNSLVSSTGLGDPQTDNYVRYNDFSCPGTPNYSAHRLAQVGEESCQIGHPVTATSSQEGSDELDGPPSMHPLAQSTSSTSSNNNTVIIPGGLMNGRNGGLGSYRSHSCGGRVKKKMDFYPHQMTYVAAPASAIDPRLRVNLESYTLKQKSPSKMKTFRNMEEPQDERVLPQHTIPDTLAPPMPPPRGGTPLANKPEYFWDMSDVRPGMSDSPAAPHNRLASTVGEESEYELEDDLEGMLQEGQQLYTPVETAPMPPPPPRQVSAAPLPTRTAAGVSQAPVMTVIDTRRPPRRSTSPPTLPHPSQVNGLCEEEELPSRRLSNIHPDLYLPPHPSSLTGSHQTLAEEETHEGPPTRKPPPPPLANAEDDASDGGGTPTEEKTPIPGV